MALERSESSRRRSSIWSHVVLMLRERYRRRSRFLWHSLVVRILVLCAGNICRSPLAETLLRRALARRGVDAEISSAGIWAEGGLPASEGASSAAQRLGIDL